MAHLIFIAKKRELSSFQLTGPAIMGRSVECDIFVPDIFVSREHCRFEKVADGWAVVDQRSRNGIFYNGKRVYRRVLRHGDLIEIGSFTVRFDRGDIPDNLSTMTPFGEGTTIASLMDTLFAGGVRPAEYLRKSKKKPAWVRAKEEAEAAALRAQEEAAELVRVEAEKINFADNTELDLEFQMAADAENLLPQYVLVSRAILAKFSDLLEEDAAESTAPQRDTAMEPAVRRPAAGGSLSIDADDSSVAAAVGISARPAQKAPEAMAAARATGPAKDMWAGVFKEVEDAKAAKGNKKDKKARKAAGEDAPAEKKKKRKVAAPSATMGDRFKDFVEWAKTVDLSVNGVAELFLGNPKRFVTIAACIVLSVAGWGTYAATRPKYHALDLSRLTPAQQAEIDRAARSN